MLVRSSPQVDAVAKSMGIDVIALGEARIRTGSALCAECWQPIQHGEDATAMIVFDAQEGSAHLRHASCGGPSAIAAGTQLSKSLRCDYLPFGFGDPPSGMLMLRYEPNVVYDSASGGEYDLVVLNLLYSGFTVPDFDAGTGALAVRGAPLPASGLLFERDKVFLQLGDTRQPLDGFDMESRENARWRDLVLGQGGCVVFATTSAIDFPIGALEPVVALARARRLLVGGVVASVLEETGPAPVIPTGDNSTQFLLSPRVRPLIPEAVAPDWHYERAAWVRREASRCFKCSQPLEGRPVTVGVRFDGDAHGLVYYAHLECRPSEISGRVGPGPDEEIAPQGVQMAFLAGPTLLVALPCVKVVDVYIDDATNQLVDTGLPTIMVDISMATVIGAGATLIPDSSGVSVVPQCPGWAVSLIDGRQLHVHRPDAPPQYEEHTPVWSPIEYDVTDASADVLAAAGEVLVVFTTVADDESFAASVRAGILVGDHEAGGMAVVRCPVVDERT